MRKNEYFKGLSNRVYLLENREEKNLIHQFHHRTIMMELEAMKGKYTLNEIR